MNNPKTSIRSPQQVAPHRGPGAMPGFEKPKDTGRIIRRLLEYMANRKIQLLIVSVLMLISAAGSLMGNYLLKPLINNYILPGDFTGLARMLTLMGGVYLVSVIASYVQSRLMLQIAQKNDQFHAPGPVRQDAVFAAEIFRHPYAWRIDEPLHQRYRQRADCLRAKPVAVVLQFAHVHRRPWL